MKRVKNLLVLVIAVLMLVVSVSPAFAADEYKITINNPSGNVSMNGITYEAYKVFDVTLGDLDADLVIPDGSVVTSPEDANPPVDKNGNLYRVEGVEAVIADSTIQLSWNEVPGAIEYLVYVNDQNYDTTDTTSFDVTGCTPNTAYDISVICKFADDSVQSLEYAYVLKVKTPVTKLDHERTYAYVVSEEFKDFVYEGKTGDELVEYVATFTDESDELNKFAAAVKDYISTNNISAAGSVTATADNTAEITVSELGYYIVMEKADSVDGDNTLTAFCALNTTDTDAILNLKVDAPTITKQVKSNEAAYGVWTDAKIGDTVKFLLTVTVPQYADYYDNYTYIVHDSMESGLTLTDGTLKVYSDAELTTEVDAANYAVTTEDICTFDLQLNNDFVQANTGATYYIAYDATVNGDVEIYTDSNDNVANIEYSADAYDETATAFTPDKTAKVYSYSFDFLKYYVNENNEEIPLRGAQFKLFSDAACENEVKVVGLNDTTYRVALEGEAAADYIVSVEGEMTVQGLDIGTYYLKEMIAPNGYNLLDDAIVINIEATANADGSDVETISVSQDGTVVECVKIENKSGTKLPFTGGIGSTIFFVIGGILVIGACVLLITYLRVSGKKEDN